MNDRMVKGILMNSEMTQISLMEMGAMIHVKWKITGHELEELRLQKTSV